MQYGMWKGSKMKLKLERLFIKTPHLKHVSHVRGRLLQNPHVLTMAIQSSHLVHHCYICS